MGVSASRGVAYMAIKLIVGLGNPELNIKTQDTMPVNGLSVL